MRCSAPFSAVLYLELHATEGPVAKLSPLRRSRTFQVGGEDEKDEMLMLNAYRQIDEPDGIFAFNLRHDCASHLIAYEQQEEWSKALGLFDSLIASEPASSSHSASLGPSAVAAMHSRGYTSLPLVVSRHLPGANGEALCESLWRSGQWDESEEESASLHYRCLTEGGARQRGFHGSLLDALRALVKVTGGDGRVEQVDVFLTAAALSAIEDVSGRSLESTKNSQRALARLQCCQDVSDFCGVVSVSEAGASRTGGDGRPEKREDVVKAILERWERRYRSLESSFSLQEPALALHGVLLGVVRLCAHPNARGRRGVLKPIRLWAHLQRP